MTRPWLAAAFCLLVCAGCTGQMQTNYDLRVREDGSFMGSTDLIAEKGELHPAVYEMLLAHPDLPFGFGGHEGPQRDRNRRVVAAIAGQANEMLRTRGTTLIIGGGSGLKIMISRRSRTLAVSWLADRGEDAVSYFVDLGAVAGAFDPKASLDVRAVERDVILLKGGQ